jgi:hypothetical protein
MGVSMNNKSTTKYIIFFNDFEPEQLKQPANDNYIQQASLPLNYANDNNSEDDEIKS